MLFFIAMLFGALGLVGALAVAASPFLLVFAPAMALPVFFTGMMVYMCGVAICLIMDVI